MNKNNSNDLLAFLAGLAVGGAVGYYLNSEYGRKMRTESVQKISEVKDHAKQAISEHAHNVSEKFASAIDVVKEKANTITESAQSRFQKGMENAKNEIEVAKTK